jgi:hypothetical protein
VAACLLLFLVGVFGVKVTRHWRVPPVEIGRFKATHVSPETRARLAALPDEAFVTYYVSDRARMPSHMRRVERGVTDVLQSLKQASGGRFDYQVVDPEEDPDLQRYAARRGVAPFRSRSVERDSYSERTVWSALTIALGARPESAISGIGPEHLPRLQALLLDHLAQMEKPRRPVVALSRTDGFAELAAGLKESAEVVVAHLTAGPLAERADLLFWLEPAGRPDELRAVDDFLARGRSVVVAGSEKAAAAEETARGLRMAFDRTGSDMEAILDHFGLRPLPGLVLDGKAAEISSRGGPVTVPFFVRSLPYSQDFRSMRGQPNGALLFLAPTAIAINGPGLEERGWTADVLVSTSEQTSVVPVPAAPVAAGDLVAGVGEPAPKLPLAVLLRPVDPWKGQVVAFGAATPFADGFFEARGTAHRALLRTLLDNLASPERLALHRAGVLRPQPVPEQSWTGRLAWRAACVLPLPVLLGAVALTRPTGSRRPPHPALETRPASWRIALRVAGGMVVVAVIVPLVSSLGLRADLSRDGLNELGPETRAIASRMVRERRVHAEVVFSAPDRLPPAMRPYFEELLRELRELGRAGADISVTRVRPEEADKEGVERLKALGIEPQKMATRDEEATIVRTIYSSLRLASNGRSEVLHFAGPASFESLEFRLAFALRRLETGVRPVIAFATDAPRLTPAEAHEQYQTQGLMAPMGKDVYSLARRFLDECGFVVTHVDVREPVLPESYDLLIWLQPRRPLENLLNATIRHLHAGGRVLIAAQHFNVQSRQYRGTGFKLVYWPQPQWPELDEQYFPGIGIHLVREVLFDELSTRIATDAQVNRGSRPEMDRQVSALPFLVRASAPHFAPGSAITAGLGDQAFVWGSYIRWDEKRLRELGIRATPLITTSEHSWSYAWKGRWIPDETLAGPPRDDSGKPLWLGKQALAALFEGPFPFEVVVRREGRPFGQPSPTATTDGPAPTQRATLPSPAVPPPAGGEGKLLLIGSSEMFKDHRLRAPGFRADHLLLNAVAALALDRDLAAVASRRRVARGFGHVESSTKLRWRTLVLGTMPAVLLAAAVLRGLASRRSPRAGTKD